MSDISQEAIDLRDKHTQPVICSVTGEVRHYATDTLAAIQEALDRTTPPGYVLVPVEPTWEMQVHGRNAVDTEFEDFDTDHAFVVYRAMIAAAKSETGHVSEINKTLCQKGSG